MPEIDWVCYPSVHRARNYHATVLMDARCMWWLSFSCVLRSLACLNAQQDRVVSQVELSRQTCLTMQSFADSQMGADRLPDMALWL